MKLLIAAGTKKREITGAYAICASREDLTHLRDIIDKALEDDLTYGWIEVTEPLPSFANMPPTQWEE